MKKNILIILILFMLLAIFLNFLPRINYNYPLHADEYVHYQYANHLSSNSALYFGQQYRSNLEAGFHYLLATLNSFGAPYLFIFRYLSILITTAICLFVFILTRRIWNERAALFSVLFISLLQSSAALLGPAFVIPLSIGLILILAGLYLIKIKSDCWFLILASLLIIHPPSALAFFLLANIAFLINRKNYSKNLLLELLAGVIAFPLYWNILLEKGAETIDYLSFTIISSPLFIPAFIGWFEVFIILIGVYASLIKKDYSFTFYSIALLLFAFIFYQLKLEIFIPYARVLIYLFVIFSVLFGIGCDNIVKINSKQKIRNILAVILFSAVLILAIPAKLESNRHFYHLIDNKDYQSFEWIKQNSNPNQSAILDPWKANAFTPIAERQVYSRIMQGPNNFSEARNKEIYLFFKNNCTDADFLSRNNISIVYGVCNSTRLNEVYPNVYLFSDRT